MDSKRETGKQYQNIDKHKTKKQLLKLVDNNQILFKDLKQDLMAQLSAYQQAFSRQHNKYVEDRDFDPFKLKFEKFRLKGKNFVDRLASIKNNCTKVIKNLPQQQKLTSTQTVNCFDMFVDQQINGMIQYKMKEIQYQNDEQSLSKNKQKLRQKINSFKQSEMEPQI